MIIPRPSPSEADDEKLLRRLERALWARRYSPRTVKTYRAWVVRYVRFFGMRHPAELGTGDVNRFLTYIATERGVGPSAQAQARASLLFLYREVLGAPLDRVASGPEVLRGKQRKRLPVVLDRQEVAAVLKAMRGLQQLAASVLYGSGLRLGECLGLRTKDLDLARRELVVREGKGRADRVSMIPHTLVQRLEEHLHVR